MLTRRAIAVAVALTVTPVTVVNLYAQDGSDAPAVRRPFRGIFGAPSSSNSAHSLVATGSVFAAYDDNVFESISDRRVSSPWLQKSGTYQGASAGLGYGFNKGGERFDFRAHSGAQLHYYRHDENSGARPAYQADVALSARLTRSLTFAARQSASYASSYNAALIPQLGEESGHDIGIADDVALDLFALKSLRTATTLSLSQSLGRHTSIRAAYNFRSRVILDSELPESRFRDYGTHAGSAGIDYSYPMTRNATLRLGYGIRVSDRRSGTGEPQALHNIDAGVNYSRALSFSRRTSLSFGSGSAIAVRDRLDGTEGNLRPRARLVGNAALVHEMGRTWTARLTYARGFRTRDGFNDLYFTDGVNAGVGGLVTRRLSFSAATAWTGSSRETQVGGRQRGQSASAQAQYALSRYLALYAQYSYYHYRYDDEIPLDGRFPRQLDRHGVRIGVTTSVPLIR